MIKRLFVGGPAHAKWLYVHPDAFYWRVPIPNAAPISFEITEYPECEPVKIAEYEKHGNVFKFVPMLNRHTSRRKPATSAMQDSFERCPEYALRLILQKAQRHL